MSWKDRLEHLVDQESNEPWRPFPEHFTDPRSPRELSIQQINLTNPSTHVICKITDDFATMQQYSFDEESLPPKVLCWNDVSALDIKMATKTVKSGIENEYRQIVNDLSISFQSVSLGNRDPLPLPSSRKPELLIYHVLDPTLTQKSRLPPATSAPTKMKLSRSSPSLAEPTLPYGVQVIQSPPIQDDPEGLRRIADAIEIPAIFILDCSYAHKALHVLTERSKPYIVFAATSESLLYTPQLPCDLFTSALLTPAKVALLWQSQSYSDIRSGLLSEIDIQSLIDLLNDSASAGEMLRMLESALEAYVDRMMQEALKDSPSLFYACFRKSPIISKLFSSFLFAGRMMRSVSIMPFSYPSLPDLTNHPLWDSFDLQVDRALYSIKESLKPKPVNLFSFDGLLEEHLGRLESWLWFGKKGRSMPDELPYLGLLFSSERYFPRAIQFCARYVEISSEATASFLNTKAFPLLPALLNGPSLLDNASPETVAHFSFVVVNCVLLVPELAASFEGHVDFWLRHVRSEEEELRCAALCCLLLFLDSPGNVEMYKKEGLDKLLKEFCLVNSTRIRTLAHLVLSRMGIGLEDSTTQISDESSPECRAALVARVAAAMESISNEIMEKESERLQNGTGSENVVIQGQMPDTKQTTDNLSQKKGELTEMFYNLILALNDPYPQVREESLVAISKALKREPESFIKSFAGFISDWKDTTANNPIITLLGHELQILMFEPSRRMNERLAEFLVFLSKLFSSPKESVPLSSQLVRFTLTKLSQSTAGDLSPLSFSPNSMVHKESKLIGRPTMSPSGLFACGDADGGIICQSTVGSASSSNRFDFFKSSLLVSSTPKEFRELVAARSKTTQKVEFSTFIDDTRLIAISDRSQVVVIDTTSNADAVCAFWMSPPDIGTQVIADYNHRTFEIIHSTGSALAHLFDLETQRKVGDIRLPRGKTSCVQWLKPFSSLFVACQEDLMIFDSRSSGAQARIEGGGHNIVGVNSSGAMPLYLIGGYSDGRVTMTDMRMMNEVASRKLNAGIAQFDVHRQLPFSAAVSEGLISFSFENGVLAPEEQDVGGIPEAFALHVSESSCAVRCGNKVHHVVIDY